MSVFKTEARCYHGNCFKKYFSFGHNKYEAVGERFAMKSTKKKGTPKIYGFKGIQPLKELSEEIAVECLLSADNPIEINLPLLQDLKKYEYSYRKVVEEFSWTLNKWLELRKENINAIQKSIQRFRLIHRTTTSISLMSSTAEFATSVAIILKDLFYSNFRTKLPLAIVPVLGGISMTSSLIALSYSKITLEDISKELRNEKRLQRDLEIIYRKGNWIDSAVQDLFPFGIDLNLLKKTVLNGERNLTDDQSWRYHVCSAIVITNIEKDKNILNDSFLRRVKTFVESSTAQVWISWMKVRKLLDEMNSIFENISEKELSFGREVFLSRAAIDLYPAYIPLFVNSENTEKFRFLGSCLRSMVAVMDLRENEVDEFREMRNIASKLKEDYKKIRKLNEDLFIDYD